jgi:hypothetical protein
MRVRYFTVILLLVLSWTVQSQISADGDIQNLQRQIQLWQRIVQEGQGAPDQKALNLKRLQDRERELLQLVNLRIAQLQTSLPKQFGNDRQLALQRLEELVAIRTSLGGQINTSVRDSNPAAATRARSVMSSRPSTRAAASFAETASATIVLNPITAGDEQVTGQSAPGVTRIRLEIRTDDSEQAAVTRFSHTGGLSSGIVVTDIRYTPNSNGGSSFTVVLSAPLRQNQEVRAIPNGEVVHATPWLRVRSVSGRPRGSAANPILATPVSVVRPANGSVLTDITTVTLDPISDTSNATIPVRIVTDHNSVNGDEFVVTVENGGKQVDKIELLVPMGSDTAAGIVKLAEGTNTVKVTHKHNTALTYTRTVIYTAPPKAASTDDQTTARNTIHTRAIVGIEEAAASSMSPTQKFYVDFNLNVPIGRAKKDKRGQPKDELDGNFWVWANPRITSLPQPSVTNVSDVVSGGNFFDPVSKGKVKEITQGFEFTVGGEVPIIKPRDGKNIPSGFGEDFHGRLGLSFIFGGGAITPFNPQDTAAVFKVNDGIVARYPNAKGKDFVAFISSDRDRFFRQYFAGLRLKTYFFRGTDRGADVADIFPGLFDITYGQNESVTGGKLRGGVFRIEGFYPLPFYPAVHVYGTALMKLNHGTANTPLILQVPDTIPSLSDPKLDLEVVPPVDRDYYKIGFGIDLLHLKKPKPAESTDTKKGGSN